MLPPAVHERRDGSSIHVVESTAQQRISAAGEVVHRGRIVEPAIEPRLHRVLIGRRHVGQVPGGGHQRADVVREHVVREGGAGGALQRERPAAERDHGE